MRAVRASPEFRRVAELPRRRWQDRALVELVTQAFTREGSAAVLFPQQAAALAEAAQYGGALVPLGVGQGKTLISLLLPRIVECSRPLLVLPAKHVQKTQRALAELRGDWLVPRFLRIVSYEFLGRVQGSKYLDDFQPDLIVADEAHKLKNPRAGVTRRVKRYVEGKREAGEQLACVFLSGTMTRKSLKDYAHLAQWALPEGCPVPSTWVELEDWSNALDVGAVNPMQRTDPGALLSFADPEDKDPDVRARARRGFGRRLAETPGVIINPDAVLGTSLTIDHVPTVENDDVDEAFSRLRKEWELPNGQELEDAPVVWAAARQLACEFYYVWDPAPPKDWLVARKAWRAWVLEQLKAGRGDTALEVTQRHGDGVLEVEDWRKIRDTFRVNTKAIWLGDNVLRMAADWAHAKERKGQGIVWVEHVAVGEALAALSGLPYFREQGRDAQKRFIEDHKGPIIASMHSCRDGFNLQGAAAAHHWDNLVLTAPSSGEWWEQFLGRTHRNGQDADTVTASVYVGCAENLDAFWNKAIPQARYMSATLGAPFKILHADVDLPTETDMLSSNARSKKTLARWTR